MSEKVKSMATNKTDYTVVQGRSKDGMLHIQGAGPKVNRDYGVAVSFEVDEDIRIWMDELPHTEKTLAGTSAVYFPLQYAIRNDVVHFQVRGENFNRAYGAAFNVPKTDVAELVEFAA